MSDLVEASSVTVKTMADGTLRLSVDIEPRFARVAFGLFGSPGTSMALAALKGVGQVEEKPAPQKPAGPLCKWVAIRCKEPLFFAFMAPTYDKFMGGAGLGCGDVSPDKDFAGSKEKWCAHAVKAMCGVGSRADIDGNKDAESRLHTLIREPYSRFVEQRGRKP